MSSTEDQPRGTVSDIIDTYVARAIARKQAENEALDWDQLTREEDTRRHYLAGHVKAGIATLLEVCPPVSNPNWFQTRKTLKPVLMGRYVLALPNPLRKDPDTPRAVYVQPLIEYVDTPQKLELISLDVYAGIDADAVAGSGRLNPNGELTHFNYIGNRSITKQDFHERFASDDHGIRYFGRKGLERLEGFHPLLHQTIAHAIEPAEA